MILLFIFSIFISTVVQCQNYGINSSTSDASKIILNKHVYVLKNECSDQENCIRFCCGLVEECNEENFKLELVPELIRDSYTILKGHPICSESEEFFEEDEPWSFLAVKNRRKQELQLKLFLIRMVQFSYKERLLKSILIPNTA